MPSPRKLVVTLLLALILVATVSSASAAASVTTTHEDGPIKPWAMPDSCSSLPKGVSLTGTGQRHNVTITRTKADGSQTVDNNDLVIGNASDSIGGTYHYSYHNHTIRIFPASGAPQVAHATMVDSFVLNGSGSIGHIDTGFNQRWDYDYVVGGPDWPPVPGTLQMVSSHGDTNCDPI